MTPAIVAVVCTTPTTTVRRHPTRAWVDKITASTVTEAYTPIPTRSAMDTDVTPAAVFATTVKPMATPV